MKRHRNEFRIYNEYSSTYQLHIQRTLRVNDFDSFKRLN